MIHRLLVIQHIERESPALFTSVATKLGLDIVISNMDKGDSLIYPTKNDILLVLGGPMGIADLSNPLYNWLSEELAVIKYANINNIPLIGVCLGAQLLAFANGGGVEPLIEPNTKKKKAEIGWSAIDFLNTQIESTIFYKLSVPFYGLHWHGDKMILPKNAILMASTPRCREQMFKIGSCAYGIQFHIEVEELDYIRWINEDNNFIEKGLGTNGENILKQQISICIQTKTNRIQMINNLFNYILNI